MDSSPITTTRLHVCIKFLWNTYHMAEFFPSIWKSRRDKTESTFPLRNPTSPFSQKCDFKKKINNSTSFWGLFFVSMACCDIICVPARWTRELSVWHELKRTSLSLNQGSASVYSKTFYFPLVIFCYYFFCLFT